MDIFMVLGLLMTLESRDFVLVQDRIEFEIMPQCVERIDKAFRTRVEEIPELADVTPQVLRHTSAV